MIRIAGYLVNHPTGLEGERGVGYDYILASNGLFIRAANAHLKVIIPIAEAEVRGLGPVTPGVSLQHGKIPVWLWDLAVSAFVGSPRTEMYLAYTWEDGVYHLKHPKQESTSIAVKYERLPNTVLEVHSHASMPAFFSHTDTEDEKGFGLFGVVGRLDEEHPEVRLRLGSTATLPTSPGVPSSLARRR